MSVDGAYPPELEAWVLRLEEWERLRARADPDVHVLPRAFTDYVALALASGIIGNVGYDLVKAALRRWRRPRVRLPERARGLRDAVLIAVLATQARCAEVGLPAPGLDDLDVVRCERRDDRWVAELRRADRGPAMRGSGSWPAGVALAATVEIPDGPLDGRDLAVTVIAKGDVEAAVRAEADRLREFIRTFNPPSRDGRDGPY